MTTPHPQAHLLRAYVDADRAMLAQAAPAAVASPLTKLQRKAIAVCFTSDKVSVSEVQRKLSISYADAQTLCQSIVDLGLTDELELAPSLKRGAPAPHPAPVAQGDARVQGLIAAADYIDGPASGYAAEHSYTEPSPMAKVAAALRQKAEQEDAAYQARRSDQGLMESEWGPMEDAPPHEDPPMHVAVVEGDDAVRTLQWNRDVAAFAYPVGTLLYAAHPAAPAAQGDALDAERHEMDARHAAIYRWMLSHADDVLNIFDNWFADEEADTDELHDALAARAAKEGDQHG